MPNATRNCLAPDCEKKRPKSQLMCPECWGKVPIDVRDEVYETYSNNPGGTARYSAAHSAAIQKAIRAVKNL